MLQRQRLLPILFLKNNVNVDPAVYIEVTGHLLKYRAPCMGQRGATFIFLHERAVRRGMSRVKRHKSTDCDSHALFINKLKLLNSINYAQFK